MNLPRTELRKENLIQDLQSKTKYLERKKENLKNEIEKVEQKKRRLDVTKKKFEHDIEEINSLQQQIQQDLGTLRSKSFDQPTQGQTKNSLDDLYRDYEYLRGTPRESIPPSILSEYNL